MNSVFPKTGIIPAHANDVIESERMGFAGENKTNCHTEVTKKNRNFFLSNFQKVINTSILYQASPICVFVNKMETGVAP